MEIQLVYYSTKDQITHIFMKALARAKFEQFWTMLGVIKICIKEEPGYFETLNVASSYDVLVDTYGFYLSIYVEKFHGKIVPLVSDYPSSHPYRWVVLDIPIRLL
ncbi:hypothetical protein CR513_47277, partial [Mucuna pruriens]